MSNCRRQHRFLTVPDCVTERKGVVLFLRSVLAVGVPDWWAGSRTKRYQRSVSERGVRTVYIDLDCKSQKDETATARSGTSQNIEALSSSLVNSRCVRSPSQRVQLQGGVLTAHPCPLPSNHRPGTPRPSHERGGSLVPSRWEYWLDTCQTNDSNNAPSCESRGASQIYLLIRPSWVMEVRRGPCLVDSSIRRPRCACKLG